MAQNCCANTEFTGLDPAYKRILWIIIAINGLMFGVEMIAGIQAQSQALQADALDFLGDTLSYGISLWAIGKSVTIRSNAALFKGLSLTLMAIWVLGSTIYRVFVLNSPQPITMGSVAVAAFAANVLSVLLLMRYKDGDANVRSVWLCSRNDAIGNLVVLCAAGAVWWLGSAWPDLLVAAIMAGLFLSSAWQITRQALKEKRDAALACSSEPEKDTCCSSEPKKDTCCS
ncbi:cation transporter [Neptunomonas phycophila]|jgi:cation diffusion facilitator family transporter|uniref:Cation transporter n=1 Tax=Neptunomonas phycophila TaxID=1572645 RepID=A0ABT9EV63_9GAMM|nr:cation transporter [Neptunomonas phycophila]MBT3145685.1 cation transporter [Neptunomonas phycophila]MDO6469311.1 cation transporter [Neptunomonas phycophila]MDO6784355.1 cation transporter [Neptunomonas phycophila]MDP2522948.1 cation transporter [Neptunomonas phycophila]